MESKISSRVGVAWVSLIVGITLMLIKFWAYQLTNSKAILSDALESIVNVTAAIVALIVIKISIKPADKDHPYGHGKAEYFSMAFEGGFITFAAIAIYLESLRSLFLGGELKNLNQGLIITLFAGSANGLLGLFLKFKGKNENSLALQASGDHVLSDFWTSVGLGIGILLVTLTGISWLDPAVAMIFGAYLFYTGFKIVKQSLGGLMDAEDYKAIEEIAKVFQKHSFPGIIRIHHTRIIRSGSYHHIDAHVVVPEFWDVKKSHDETGRFEKNVIRDYFTDGEIHFHVDPCRLAYCKACDLNDCKIRKEPFQERIPFSIEELTAPDEPFEFRSN